ncbi:uncharacterized protein PITG_10629 [Phytophthora infestans T30-4]|uniref:Uncharacterized protein n=1 Tax=Phytophthora infestans (strain T30-4) TaxID=403677 RepID=D0NGQ7_PHYIT|nr:uncharacterized protein PITG_10629 [Phytophthora infestans T30-4]EEY58546.1 conserved hypothetical protein [Phytophthora infestans T30-4]|eukprot:XP_002901490.1 conserved hypothetical protein [Phytophthora infestans T30-4]
MTTAGVAPLLAVTLIFRSKPAFESLSLTHVVDSVTTFLDSALELPIKKACQFNSTRLLDRIWDSSIELAASSDTSWSIRNLLQTETHYRGFQFTFSIVKAIQLRNLEMIQWLCEHFPALMVVQKCVEEAAAVGSIEILQYLLEKGVNVNALDDEDEDNEGVHDAAANGHITMLEFLTEEGYIQDDTVGLLLKAADAGQPIYMYPSSPRETELQTEPSKPGYTTAAMDGAAGNGHLNVLRWLLENESEGCTTQAMSLAARNGHFEVVQWLCDNIQKDWIASAMDSAASGGHIEILEWLHERGFQCSVDAMDGAASGGHLEAVKWLQDHRSEGCTKAAMDGAVSCGALRLVKWLHENRSEGCTRSAFYKAALLGHLDVIKWLLENYSEEFPPFAMENAALSLSFEVVLFLHRAKRGGCSSAAKIVRYLSLDMLRWLHENYREAMLENGGLFFLSYHYPSN